MKSGAQIVIIKDKCPHTFKQLHYETKSILAFSGGLDTSVVVKYMQDMHDMDVITVTVDVGQGDDNTKISKKAKKLGVKNITT